MSWEPTREQQIEYARRMGAEWLDAAIRERSAEAEGRIAKSFPVPEFDDGARIKGWPKWAEHIALGGYRELGWSAFDQRQRGKAVASGKWGERLLLLSDGRITSHSRREYLTVLREARALIQEPQP